MLLYPAPRIEAALVAELPDPDRTTTLDDIDDLAERNARRAMFAVAALKGYVAVTGAVEAPDTSIADLLGDLRHLCDALGLDFGQLSDRGYSYYSEELAGHL